MDQPARKTIRLKDYDYSSPGAYFITICTRGRRCILSEIEKLDGGAVGALHEAPAVRHTLTPEGECVRRYIEAIPGRWPAVHVDSYVIMPNHIHLLLHIDTAWAIHESPLRPNGKRSLISNVVGYLKMNSSREIHHLQPGKQIWQRSFYDHVVRNEADFLQAAEYIGANPARWENDRFRAET